MSLRHFTDEEVYNKVDESSINQARPMIEMVIRLKNSMIDTRIAIDEFNQASSK